MTYSQRDEEAVILANTPERGSFLEIGAFSPFVFSNTRALYERGWGGVLVEPSPDCFKGLMQEYGNNPRIKLVNALLTAEHAGLTKFYASPDAVGTAVEKNYQTWKGHGQFTEIYVPALPAKQLVDALNLRADFISIDTEGSSFEILKAIDLAAVGCNLDCVEADCNKADLFEFLRLCDFKVIHETAENVIAKRIG